MKKLLALMFAVLMVLSLAGCSGNTAATEEKEETTTEETVPEETVEIDTFDYSAKSEGVMTYADFAAVPSDGSTEVTIEAYVQGAQSYWDGATMYLQDPDGAYFVYNGAISEEDYAKCVTSTDYTDTWEGTGTGVKVKVTGIKSEWSGEVEITDATVEVVDTEHTWEPMTMFAAGTTYDELSNYMNQIVTFTDCEVVSVEKKESDDDPDLYLTVNWQDHEITFCVENYLTRPGTEVYKTIEGVTAGQNIELACYLYWYNGPNPHVFHAVLH